MLIVIWFYSRPSLRPVTDGELPAEGPLTPQSHTASAPVGEPDAELVLDPRQVGGGGVGWLQPTDAARVAIIALPGGIGGGVAVPLGPADAVGQADRRDEAAESPRAVGVAAAILALLLAASSTVWALYKFKPGLVRDQPEVEVPPLYTIDQFYDSYKPPSPRSPTTPTSPGAL